MFLTTGKHKAEGDTSNASISAGQVFRGETATLSTGDSPSASEASTAHTAIVYSNVSPQGLAFAHGPFSPLPHPAHDTADEAQASAATHVPASQGSHLQGRGAATTSRGTEQDGHQQHTTTASSIPQYHGLSQGWDDDDDDDEGEEVDSKLGAVKSRKGRQEVPEIVPTEPVGVAPAAGRPGQPSRPGTVMVSLGAQQTVRGTPAAAKALPPLMVDTGGQGLPIIPEAPNTGNSTSAANQFRLSQVLSPMVGRLDPAQASKQAGDAGVHSKANQTSGPSVLVSI